MMMYNKLSMVTVVFAVGLLCVLVAVLTVEGLDIKKPDIDIDKPDIDIDKPDIDLPHPDLPDMPDMPDMPEMPSMSSLEMAALKRALKAMLRKIESYIPGMGD